MAMQYISISGKNRSYESGFLSEPTLNAIFFVLNDLLGSQPLEELEEWLSKSNEVNANISRLVKLPNGNIGFGYLTSILDTYEVFPVTYKQFLTIIKEWQRIKALKPLKVILARDEDNIWFAEYHEFCKTYNINLEQPIKYNINKNIQPSLNIKNLEQGISLLSQAALNNKKNRITLLHNKKNKYGLIKIEQNSTTIEKSIFLWEWDCNTFFEALYMKIEEKSKRFYPRRNSWEGEMIVNDPSGYTITVVIDYAKNQIIAAYPCRSNFY